MLAGGDADGRPRRRLRDGFDLAGGAGRMLPLTATRSGARHAGRPGALRYGPRCARVTRFASRLTAAVVRHAIPGTGHASPRPRMDRPRGGDSGGRRRPAVRRGLERRQPIGRRRVAGRSPLVRHRRLDLPEPRRGRPPAVRPGQRPGRPVRDARQTAHRRPVLLGQVPGPGCADGRAVPALALGRRPRRGGPAGPVRPRPHLAVRRGAVRAGRLGRRPDDCARSACRPRGTWC